MQPLKALLFPEANLLFRHLALGNYELHVAFI